MLLLLLQVLLLKHIYVVVDYNKYLTLTLVIVISGMGLSARSTGGLYPAPTSSSGTGTPCYRQTSAPNLKGKNVRDTLSKQVQISPNDCNCTN